MLTKTYFRRKLAQACGLGLVLCAAAACAPQQNVLTKEEIADGWQLLFDGKTLDQWKDYNGEELTMPWHVVDGCIQAKGDGSDLAGYIVTKKQYENFILDWDWKLSHGGNSGAKSLAQLEKNISLIGEISYSLCNRFRNTSLWYPT